MNDHKSKMEDFENRLDSYQATTMEIRDFINNNLKIYFSTLHLNRFYADCMRISANIKFVKFDTPFDYAPDVFIVSNRFLITYGDDGSLEKKKIEGFATSSDINFDIGDDDSTSEIPICFLAIEKAE